MRALFLSLAESLRRRGADCAELRSVETERETLRVRGAEIEHQAREAERGVGVRVLVDGAYGFAATPDPSPAAIERAAERALTVGRAAARVAKHRIERGDAEPCVGRWAAPVAIDPFALPLEDKLAHLFEVTARLGSDRRILAARASLVFVRQRKRLVTSEGHDQAQETTLSGGGLSAVAVVGGDAQSRSYPKDGEGDLSLGGFERVRALDLAGHAERVRDEAIALCTAPECPAGRRTILLGGALLSLQLHETFGHALELDRALGAEQSLAGGSFLTPERLGEVVASPRVSLVADATMAGGPGSFGWDDEGTPARRVELVREGRFVGYLSSRDTAARLGERSSGAARAESWRRAPLVRMVNVNLEPGPADTTLEDLVADTGDGLLLDVGRAASVDERRVGFRLGAEVAWEIRRGRRTRLLRGAVYGGNTPELWGACDAVGGERDARTYGYLFCGKGDPMQLLCVGHRVPSARFRGVEVGAER